MVSNRNRKILGLLILFVTWAVLTYEIVNGFLHIFVALVWCPIGNYFGVNLLRNKWPFK